MQTVRTNVSTKNIKNQPFKGKKIMNNYTTAYKFVLGSDDLPKLIPKTRKTQKTIIF